MRSTSPFTHIYTSWWFIFGHIIITIIVISFFKEGVPMFPSEVWQRACCLQTSRSFILNSYGSFNRWVDSPPLIFHVSISSSSPSTSTMAMCVCFLLQWVNLTRPWQEAEPLRGRHSAWQATHKDPSMYSRTDLQHKEERDMTSHNIVWHSLNVFIQNSWHCQRDKHS